MALSDDRLDELSREMVKSYKSVNWLSAKIEAEVRADDEALIRKMLKALERQPDYDAVTWAAIESARARLEKAP